jgi:hypothetical protein
MQLSATLLFGLGVHKSFFFSSFFRSTSLSIFLEWSLATQFSATDEFLKKWADAQKFVFGKGAGWFVSRLFFVYTSKKKKKKLIDRLLDSSGTLESRNL